MLEKKRYEFTEWNDGLGATLSFSSGKTLKLKKGDVVELTQEEVSCYPQWFKLIPEPKPIPVAPETKPELKKEEKKKEEKKKEEKPPETKTDEKREEKKKEEKKEIF